MFRLVILMMLGLMFGSGCVSTNTAPKLHTVWTVPEVKRWFAEYRQRDRRAWNGILYQGSSERWHYFIAYEPAKDEWAIMQIKREDLAIKEERPYGGAPNHKLGYYVVDPAHGFAKLQDF